MPNIDSLSIAISAQANSAVKSLDKLIGQMDRLQTALSAINGKGLNDLASGISSLNAAVSGMGVKTTDFTRLSKNIERLGHIDVGNISQVATNISALGNSLNTLNNVTAQAAQLAELSKAVGRLGYKSVTQAITNLPILATSLSNLMTTLSTAPMVSQNLVDMTNALANLASQGSAVGVASRSMSTGLNRAGASARANARSFKGLVSVFGMFYARMFLVIRGLKKLRDAISSSMDYIETLNYFDAAFEQVASRAGTTAGTAYANSFADAAKKVTAQMTGFNINKNGTLTATDTTSLGIDPNQVMAYQAMYGQMASSMGVASAEATRLSEVMTKLGADLASVKNLNFADVWTDMASGMVGMSRTLDKYGVNIRNVNLQQQLTNLGIETNITNLNQQDKALLRAIVTLDATRYAWIDLSSTLMQPANQMRLIQANLENLSRTIGNLFLPTVARILPYINALVISIQKLAVWIGNLMGIDLSGITSSVGNSNEAISDILDNMDDVGDSIDDATDSAKKLKQQLQGFDELNVLTTNTKTNKSDVTAGLDTTAITDTFNKLSEEYLTAWQKGLDRLDNKAQEIAGKIERAFEPIKKIFADFATGHIFKAGWDTTKLITGITGWFGNAIASVDWFGIGQKIGSFIAGIDWSRIFTSVANIVWQGLIAALKTTLGMFTKAPFETAFLLWLTAPKMLKFFAKGKAFNAIKKIASSFSGAFTSAMTTAIPQFAGGNGIFSSLNKGIDAFRDNLTSIQKVSIGAVSLVGEFTLIEDGLYDLTSGSDNLLTSLGKIAGGATIGAVGMYAAFGPTGLAVAGIAGVVAAIKGINDAMDDIRADEIGKSIQDAFTNPDGVPISEVVSMFKDHMEDASSGFSTISTKSSELETAQKNIEDTWTEITKIQTAMENGVLSVGEGKQELEKLFSELAELTTTKFDAMSSAIISAYGEGGAFSLALERIGADTDGAIDAMITYGYRNSERAREIAQELANTDPNTDRYVELTKELMALSGEMDDISAATSDFTYDIKSLYGTVDFSEIIVNGEVNETKLQGYLDGATNVLSEYETKLNEAAKQVSKYWQEVLNSATATDEEKAAAEAQLNYLPQAISVMRSDAENEILEFTNLLQTELVNKTGTIVEGAVSSWKKKGTAGQIWNGIWGAGTEGAYVKESTDKFQRNMDKVSATIEGSLSKIGISGAGWGASASKAIIDGLFDTKYVRSELTGGRTTYELKDTWQSIITNSTDGITELAQDKGKDAVDGYANGIEGNISTGTDAAREFTEAVLDAIATAQDSHSPSKETEKLGQYAVQGYTFGILNSLGVGTQAANTFTTSILNNISSFTDKFTELGKTLADALSNGFNNNLKNANFTAPGLNVKGSQFFADGGFPEDGLFFANHTELVGRFANGKTAVANNAEISAGIEEAAYRGYMRAMQESGAGNTNVSVTLEGDARGLFKAVKSEWKDEARRIQGNPVPIY